MEGKAQVNNLTPAGAEPHDYEPTPEDLINIDHSLLLIVNGYVEPWIDKVKSSLSIPDDRIVVVGKDLVSQKYQDEEGDFVSDPHIWLSPKLAKEQVKTISDRLKQSFPADSEQIVKNTQNLLSELDALDVAYTQGLSSCKYHDIITSHAAFGYLATDYGLHQVPITGLSPDAEPSASQMANLTEYVRKNQIKYVFFESLVSPKLSQTLAQAANAQTLVLNPLEGLTQEDLDSHRDFFSVMYDNLHNLELALECK